MMNNQHRSLSKEDFPSTPSSPSIPNSPFSSSPLIQQHQQSHQMLSGNINGLMSQQQQHIPSTSSPPINSTTTTTTTTTTSTSKSKSSKSKEKEKKSTSKDNSNSSNINNNISDDDDDDDETKVNKGEKQKARRTNQNIASRNYRQRKKIYIKEMEDKISSLTLENDTLKKDLYKIGNNPLELLKFSQEVVFLMTQIRRLVFQIDQALRNNEPDSSIKSLLNTWQSTMDQASSINEREIERFVHPYTQAKLTVMGYKPHTNPWTDFIKTPGQEEWWAKFAEKANLSIEQQEQINNLWAKFSEEERVLQKELTELDEYIKRFFLTKIIIMPDNEKLNDIIQSCLPVPENHDSDILQTSEVLEFIYNLEKLKQKFIKVHRLTWDTSKQMSKYLTVRQEAFLLVLVHSNTKYIHTNMDMTNNLWNQLNHNSLSKTPSHMLTNVYNTSISQPTHHHQPTPQPTPQPQATHHHHTPPTSTLQITDSIHGFSQIPQMVQPQQSQPSTMYNSLPGAKPLKNQQPIDELFFGTIPLSQVPISYQQNSNINLFSGYRNFQQQQQAQQQQQSPSIQSTTPTSTPTTQIPSPTTPSPSTNQIHHPQQQTQQQHHQISQQQQHIHQLQTPSPQTQQQQHSVYQSSENNPLLNDFIYSFSNSIDGGNNSNHNNSHNNSNNNLNNISLDLQDIRQELGFKSSVTTLPIQNNSNSNNSHNNNSNNLYSQHNSQPSVPSSQTNDNFHFHYYQPVQNNNSNNGNNNQH